MKTFRLALLSLLLTATSFSFAKAHDADEAVSADKPIIQNLMTQALEGAEGLEVILSHVVLPPNFALPKHWHPGEEFAYILQGSVVVTLEGQDERLVSEGDTGMVPLRKIHWAKAGDKGATLLVFRVHEQGQPGRVLVEE